MKPAATLITPATNPPITTPMTTGITSTSAVVAMLRLPRIASIALVSNAMLASAATVPSTIRFIVNAELYLTQVSGRVAPVTPREPSRRSAPDGEDGTGRTTHHLIGHAAQQQPGDGRPGPAVQDDDAGAPVTG